MSMKAKPNNRSSNSIYTYNFKILNFQIQLPLLLTVRFHSLGWVKVGHATFSPGLGINDLAPI